MKPIRPNGSFCEATYHIEDLMFSRVTLKWISQTICVPVLGNRPRKEWRATAKNGVIAFLERELDCWRKLKT